MEISAILSGILFPPPPSVFVTAMSVVGVAGLANGGLSEVRGKNMGYSKFWDVKKANGMTIPSRSGMLLAYAPAAAAAAASFVVPGVVVGPRAQLLSLALAVHFFKRVFEVLFVHQYSGMMLLESAIPISLSYFVSTATMIYTQYLSQDMPEPSLDLKTPGLVLFLVGIAGNFYHHLLLAKLRKKDDKSYKIPSGGLFGLVICPHYLFEILGFYGVAMIAQTVYSFSFALGTTFYLVGRSLATRRWYLSKFDNFPKDVKLLVPFVF